MSIEHRYPLLQQGFIKVSASSAATHAITGTDSGKIFINTGATGSITYTLPKAAPGLSYRFVESTAHNIVITPVSTDAFRGTSAGVSKTLSGLGQNFLITCAVVGFWELF